MGFYNMTPTEEAQLHLDYAKEELASARKGGASASAIRGHERSVYWAEVELKESRIES